MNRYRENEALSDVLREIFYASKRHSLRNMYHSTTAYFFDPPCIYLKGQALTK